MPKQLHKPKEQLELQNKSQHWHQAKKQPKQPLGNCLSNDLNNCISKQKKVGNSIFGCDSGEGFWFLKNLR